MANVRKSRRKVKNNRKRWTIKNTIAAVVTALGITAFGGYEVYDNIIKDQNKQVEKDADDLNILNIDPIEESKIEPTIEDEIKDSLDKNITFTDESEETKEKIDEEVLEKIEEIGKNVLEESEKIEKETESLDISKDKKNTITSYSDVNYNYDDLVVPIIKNFETISIVDALNEVGYDSSISSRARLAVYFNIVSNEEEFKGFDYQNIPLLEALRQYAKNLQASAYNDYANVIDNKTIESSISDNSYSYDYADDSNIKTTKEELEEKENIKDDKDKDHEHRWSQWQGFDDNQEYRKCPDCGEIEYQGHSSYGEWIDNLDNTESRTCANCGYVQTRKKEHKHHPEATKPVSLNRTDEKNCMVVNYVCPDDGFIDESLRKYIPHELSEKPIAVDGDKELYECKKCGIYITKTIEQEKHEHKFEATKPVSLNRTDEKNCMVIDYVCPDDGFIDESLRKYIPHELSEKPIAVDGDKELYECKKCGMYVTKTVSNTQNEDTSSLENTEAENVIINFEFDIPLINEDEYEYFDEEEVEEHLELPAVVEGEELEVVDDEEKNLTTNTTYLLEDKGAPLMLEEKQDNIQNILASFDTELYKRLFKEKVALEQELATNKGIERKEKLQLLKDIDAVKASMVQDLANALVKEELKAMEKESTQELVFKV